MLSYRLLLIRHCLVGLLLFYLIFTIALLLNFWNYFGNWVNKFKAVIYTIFYIGDFLFDHEQSDLFPSALYEQEK